MRYDYEIYRYARFYEAESKIILGVMQMARKNRRKRIVKDTAIEELISLKTNKTVPPSPWDVSKSLREQSKREKIVTERLTKIDTWVTRACQVVFIILGICVLMLLHVHGII